MSSKRRRRIKNKNQTIHINVTNSKMSPGQLNKKRKSSFEKRIVIEEMGSYLGEGAHGSVHSAKIHQIGGGIISYAVKTPPECYNFNKRVNIVNLWYKRIEEMRKIGIKNVVDYAEVIDDRLFLTDLRIYGQVLDFENKMDLNIVNNLDFVLKGMAQDMAVIHSNNYILSDNGGTYGFRAWFLLRSKTREGFVGERVICDVGGIETEPPNFQFRGDLSKENFNRLMNDYVKMNIVSLFAITDFNEKLSINICNEYFNSCSNDNIKSIADNVLFLLNNDISKLKSYYYWALHET